MSFLIKCVQNHLHWHMHIVSIAELLFTLFIRIYMHLLCTWVNIPIHDTSLTSKCMHMHAQLIFINVRRFKKLNTKFWHLNNLLRSTTDRQWVIHNKPSILFVKIAGWIPVWSEIPSSQKHQQKISLVGVWKRTSKR